MGQKLNGWVSGISDLQNWQIMITGNRGSDLKEIVKFNGRKPLNRYRPSFFIMQKNDLPFSSEFSPNQIDLRIVLEIAKQNEGNGASMEKCFIETFFNEKGGNEYNRNKLGNNCKLSIKAYGIVDEDYRFTDFGNELYESRLDEDKMHFLLAKQILLNLNGMILIECVQDLWKTHGKVTLELIRPALSDYGIYVSSAAKRVSILRLWLSKVGIFSDKGWDVNEKRLKEIIGIDVDDYREMQDLTHEQRAFLQALINTGITSLQPSNSITKLAETTYGVKFPEKSLPKAILSTLHDKGYIVMEKTTGGRGAKPYLVAPTEKLIVEVIEPLFAQLESVIDPKLIRQIREPFETIIANLDSDDRHVSGLALEALAFKLMRLIDLTYHSTRLRTEQTGGAEVDLIFHSARLVYSRWQVQCKNTATVSLDDVAKEVGLTHLLKSNVIVIVTTGRIGQEARRYANKIMTDMNLCIVMIDGEDIKKIVNDPPEIVNVFNREAEHAMELKVLEK